MSDFLMMTLAFFCALLCVLILGRLIVGLMVIALVVIFGLLALMISLPILIVALPFLLIAYAFKRDSWEWSWENCDEDDDDDFEDSGSILINGVLMRCDKCGRRASSVSQGKSRCKRH